MHAPRRPAFLSELDRLAWWLVVLLGVEVVLGPINAVVNVFRMRGTDLAMTIDTRPGAPPTSVETFRSMSAGPLGVPAGLLSVTLIVLWLVWQHRATSRLWAYGLQGLRVTPGWAVGWWFIPFASLVMPFVAMRELDARSADGRARPALLWAWWLCYMVAPLVVVSVAVGAMFRSFIAAASSNQQVITVDLGAFVRWIPVAGLFTGVAAALACAIVLGIERAQARLVPTIAAPARPDLVVPIVAREPVAAIARPIGRTGRGEVPPRGLGSVLIVLLAAQVVIANLGVLAFLVHLTAYRRVELGHAVAAQDLRRANDLVDVALSLWIVAFLVTVVVWCVWQHHAQRTLVRLTHGTARFTPGWAVGWWFVPFANLVRPFQAVHELWSWSRGAVGEPARAKAWILPAWWATWLGWWVLSVVGSSASGSWHAVVVDDAWTAAGYLVVAVSSALAIAIVASVRRTQSRATASLTIPPTPALGDDRGAYPPRPD
ncbi:MAG: DUF4328 domain-containing protein [Actinomycetota bacterium]